MAAVKKPKDKNGPPDPPPPPPADGSAAFVTVLIKALTTVDVTGALATQVTVADRPAVETKAWSG